MTVRTSTRQAIEPRTTEHLSQVDVGLCCALRAGWYWYFYFSSLSRGSP